MDEGRLASLVFEAASGRPAPEIDEAVYPEWARFGFVLGVQDGTLPFYETPPRPSPQAGRGLSGGGMIRLNLHGGQVKAWEAGERFVAIIAGKQGGKTTFAPPWLHREIQRFGRGDYLAVSATYEMLNLKMLPALKQYFVSDLGIGKYHGITKTLEICNPYTGEFAPNSTYPERMWARIILRSADREEALQSATGKLAWLDEAGLYAPRVWKDVRGRLALNRGRILITTTPYNMGWLKSQVIDNRDDDDYCVVQFASRENPFFSEDEFLALKAEMPAWRFAMDYEGRLSSPPGLIYPEFVADYEDVGGHVVEAFDIPHDWVRVAAIDPGEVNPGKLWFAEHPVSGQWFLYREQVGGERLTSKEHARDDVALVRESGERIQWWAIGAKSEQYWRDDYKSAGAGRVVAPSVFEVEEGIDRAVWVIKQDKLRVFDTCVGFLRQMGEYRRELDKHGDVTTKIKDKSSYHLMDAFRYFAVQVAKPRGSAKVRVKQAI